MSSEQHITLSEIKEIISIIQNDCRSRFVNYESNNLLTQVTILDTRFKKLSFQDKKKYENAIQVLKSKVPLLLSKESNPC